MFAGRGAPLAAGGFSEDWQYTLDLATYAAVLEKGSLVCVDETLAAFRVSSTSWSASLLGQQTSQARGSHRQLAAAQGIDPDSCAARMGRLRATTLGYMRIVVFAVIARLAGTVRLKRAMRAAGATIGRFRPVPTSKAS